MFNDVFFPPAVEDFKLTTGTVNKDMATLSFHIGATLGKNFPTEAMNLVIKVSTTGIKVVLPKRTTTEKTATKGKKKITRALNT